MHLSISSKLIFAFLGVTTVVLAATLLLARWSFEQGFLNYVNALEEERLKSLAVEIGDAYVASGRNWQQVMNNPAVKAIQRSARPKRGPPPHPGLVPPPREADHTPRGRPPGHHQPPSRPHPRPLHFPPTGLFDQADEHLAGLHRSGTNVIRVPVADNFGKTVGWLIATPKVHLNDPAESGFARQQLIASLWIGLVAIGLTLAVSWLVSRRLLAPVHRLHACVDQLAKGQYQLDHASTKTGNRDELSQLQDNVNNLADVLSKNRDVRKRWLADISHELRTPLAILVGELEALSAGLRVMDQNQLDSLLEEANHLNKVVEDLYELALSDIGGLRYQFVATDLNQLVRDVVRTLNGQQSQIEIQYVSNEQLPDLDLDPVRIRQLVLNVLRNSLLYTDYPGTIEVTLQQENNLVQLEIMDSPPGVPADICEALFEPLHREDPSRHRRGQGAGLGLAICRNIVNAHKGNIHAAPAKAGGLHITITLPMDHQ